MWGGVGTADWTEGSGASGTEGLGPADGILYSEFEGTGRGNRFGREDVAGTARQDKNKTTFWKSEMAEDA